MRPPDDAPETQETAATMTVAPGVRRIFQVADSYRQAAGHEGLGQNHLLRAVLENYGLMARDLVAELDTDALLKEVQGKLDAGDAGTALDPDALLAVAGERARKRGKSAIAERDVVGATLSEAGFPVRSEEGAATETPIPVVAPPPNGTNAVPTANSAAKRFPALERYGQDLTEAARTGRLAPFIGREAEVQLVIETLCRRITRNPVLVGPAGVGKTAIVEGLAYRIAGGNVPPILQNTRLFAVVPSALTAGASHYGELEKRLEALLEEARDPSVLVFIDEVHAIVGAGGRPGSNDMATLLKPALARGEIACIAATTDDEYRRFIEQDPALERRFQPIRINELGAEATFAILQELRKVSAAARGVTVSDDALRYLIEVAARYLRNRHFPAKAVDLFEQCVASAIAGGRSEVTSADADAVVRRLVGMPTLPRERLRGLEERFAQSPVASVLLSQADRETLLNRLQVSLEGFDLRPERPNATLLLAGQSASQGGGLAREIADSLFGASDRVILIDFSRFTDPHHANMLLGSPPGYIGYSERLPLHELEQTPWCVLVCENVDDCHPSFRTMLARALETGHFTDATGKSLYVSDAVVLLTARSVTGGLDSAAGSANRRSGFLAMTERPKANGEATINVRADAERVLGPDLADHCDLIITGAVNESVAGAEERRRIEQALLRPIASRYAQEGLILDWDPAVVEYLMSREPGQTSPRDQERILDRHIAPLLLPFRNQPGAHGTQRHLTLHLTDGTLTVSEATREAE